MALVDDYDREVPVGTPGEIVVRGPLVFQGYFGQPDVTAHTFRNGWHHTGDVGRFDDEGYLYYVRRKPEKELIKPGGENVYPAEVETVIVQMDGVTGACVFGIPDVKWGEAIKAVVEVKPAGRYTAEQVSDFVGSKIARFKRPHVVAFTDALPRTADGAVDREARQDPLGDSREDLQRAARDVPGDGAELRRQGDRAAHRGVGGGGTDAALDLAAHGRAGAARRGVRREVRRRAAPTC